MKPGPTVPDIRLQARRRLPRGLFEFIDRGTEAESALANNRAALDRVRLAPRVLVDVSGRSTKTTLFGRPVAAPIAIAPTGAAGLVWLQGEMALAKAAAAMGMPFSLATRSMSGIEQVADQAGGDLWFQLYPSSAHAFELIERAKAARFTTLVVTVDTPTTPLRRYNKANGFSLPFRPNARAMLDIALHPTWFGSVIGGYLRSGGLPRFENFPERPKITGGAPASDMLEAGLSWERLKALRDRWPGTFIVKGVLNPRDAEAAAAMGADGIVVSNHGGRNLDASVAPMDALPAIVAAVGGQVTVLLDGAISHGSDIAKAIALGASGVLVGRATLYGAAVAGQAGVEHVLRLLAEELSYTMAMVGCPNVDALASDPQIVVAAP